MTETTTGSTGSAARSGRTPGHVPVSHEDPFGPVVLEDPLPFHRRLRDAGPVVHLPQYDVYAIAR